MYKRRIKRPLDVALPLTDITVLAIPMPVIAV